MGSHSKAKYTDAEAKAAAVLAGTITDSETKAPTHDAVFDVKATADAAMPSANDAAAAVTAMGAKADGNPLHHDRAGGAWVIAEEEIDSSTCGAVNSVYWDWDLSSVTGGGYFLGLFLIQKNTAVDTVKIRTNGAPGFKTTTYGSINEEQAHVDQITGCASANWIFSDANSVVEVFFEDVSDGDKAMLVAYLPFTPPQAWP